MLHFQLLNVWLNVPVEIFVVRRAYEQDVQPGPRDGEGDRRPEKEVSRQEAAHPRRHGSKAEAATKLLKDFAREDSLWVWGRITVRLVSSLTF